MPACDAPCGDSFAELGEGVSQNANGKSADERGEKKDRAERQRRGIQVLAEEA